MPHEDLEQSEKHWAILTVDKWTEGWTIEYQSALGQECLINRDGEIIGMVSEYPELAKRIKERSQSPTSIEVTMISQSGKPACITYEE